MPWDSLATYVVKVHQSLALAVAASQTHSCEVNAKVDSTTATVFVKEPAVLARMDGGGRALAALFEGDARRIAQAWRAACDGAQDGIEAQRVELAHERVAREQAELEGRLVEFQERTAERHGSLRGTAKRGHRDAVGDQRALRKPPPSEVAPRTLVEPPALMLVNREGRLDKGSPAAVVGTVGRAAISGLSEPKGGFDGRQNRTSRRAYSDVDKENVGMELLRMLLGSEQDEIVDLRNQRNVGADAVDELRKFYELKVSARSEPDQVTLTNSEVHRALSTPDFFLVVVSNIEEGGDARPTVRVVLDPLKQLKPTDRGSITLSGVRETTSLVYEFAPINDPQPTDDGE